MFPPAYYGMGKSLVLLHRHNEALAMVKEGLELLPHYHLIQLFWPGTTEGIQECHPQDIEVGVAVSGCGRDRMGSCMGRRLFFLQQELWEKVTWSVCMPFLRNEVKFATCKFDGVQREG